jgi:hypothetical protein
MRHYFPAGKRKKALTTVGEDLVDLRHANLRFAHSRPASGLAATAQRARIN